MLIDSHGRKVSYLRLSITDRCNLRCLYCRPQNEWVFLPHDDILTYEEMLELVDVSILAGVEKIRLTGGEPFARKGFIPFVARLHARYPDLDLRITTNGTMLQGRIEAIRDAGITCLNISLDTLKREKFREITGVDGYDQVRAGIDACLDDRGLRPGAMFADIELIGIPHRVVVSERGLTAGTFEYRARRGSENEALDKAALFTRLGIA